MAGPGDDFNEDDFEEYNPHPYLGGYDLALTYGAPLPPSTAICYPISSPPSPSPPSTSAAGEPLLPVSPPPEPPLPEPERHPPYEYGEPYQPEPYARPDLFRSWPYSDSDYYSGRRGEVKQYNYWNHLMRGLDYLFGHADGYSERIDGVDNYGIPIYASKKSNGESLVVEVEPAAAQRLDFYDIHDEQLRSASSGSFSSRYGERKEEPSGYGLVTYEHYNRHSYEQPGERKEEPSGYGLVTYEHYNRHSYEQPIQARFHPDDPVWDQKVSYHEVHHEGGYRYEDLSSYNDECQERDNFFANPVHSYDQHYYEQPMHIQAEPVEPAWSQKMASHEVSYDQHYYEQPMHIQAEPVESAWSQKMASHEESSLYHESDGTGQALQMLGHAYKQHSYAQSNCPQLEPYIPSWSQNLGYYQDYEEGEAFGSNHHSFMLGQQGELENSFASSFHTQEKRYSEQFQSSEHGPYHETWSGPSNYGIYQEDFPQQSKLGVESDLIDSFFCPFQKYSGYDG